MHNLSRHLHAGLYALAIAGATILPATNICAAPTAQQQSQVPGYYRMMLGSIEVTALYDGNTNLPRSTLKGINEKDLQALLARMFADQTKGMQTAVNAYLVNTGSNLILIDSGAGQCMGPGLGNITHNIQAAGYKVTQIDSVLLTHLHGDHACGLITKEGQAAFPNATVFTARSEADYWLSEQVAASMPKEVQGFFKMSRDSVAPYAAKDRLKTYTNGDQILPGIQIVPLNGHTPGHSGYLFSSGGQSLLLWGDVVHNHAVQFPRPEVAFEYDVNAEQAVAARKRILADAARDRLWIGGAHLPFPGLGHVRSEGRGAYVWVPLEYGPVKQ